MSNNFAKNGSELISALISEAIKSGARKATVSGSYEIEKPIRIPSDFTLILDECHLRLADGVYSNIFLNEHFGTDEGRGVDGRDRNIRIIGKGRAVLDGGKYNGLSEKNQLTDGRPEIWNNNLILFSNVEGFEIRNLYACEQRWWAFCFVYCSHGVISDIEFSSNDSAIAEDGTEYRGLIRGRYGDVCVKNSDGIDLRVGCHDVTIENIYGFTEDDTVALTALSWRLEEFLRVDGEPTDIYNIKIRNISSSAYCSNVRILNQGEHKIHGIYIDGVYDTSGDSPHMDRGSCGVRIGDAHMYGKRASTEEETYDVTVKNVRSRAVNSVSVRGAVGNLVIENVESFDGGGDMEDLRL